MEDSIDIYINRVVKVVRNDSSHPYEIGEKVTVLEKVEGEDFWKCLDILDKVGYLTEVEFELI